MRVAVEKFGDVRALRYSYKANEHMSFCLYLLCEVGEPWQATAKAQAEGLAAKSRCRIEQVELDAHPWYVDALVPL